MGKILEALMMIAFGVSWPAQIIKTIKVKNPKGKSFLFLFLILAGYVCGISSKFFDANGFCNGFKNWVFYIYLLDFLMVLTDLTLSLYYSSKVRKNGEQD